MVICRYFQQNACRFGTKCKNDHLDIRQIVKADMESAINGKMWPFSGYGPFKDKPCIPNFIEDQSFEEMRYLCYEAKRQNYFEQFHQQFNKEVLDATNKMKTLIHMAPQILDVVMKVYDTPENSQALTTGNPFGMSTTSTASSIFSKPTMNSGNIFGGASSGFAAQPNTANSSNIFGTAAATGLKPSNMFGGGSSGPIGGAPNASVFGQQQQTSIFGQQAQQQPAQAQPSIFGAQPPQQTQQNIYNQQATQGFQGGNIFTQPQPQQPAANVNPFGQANMVTNVYGQQQQQQPQQQPQQQSTSIFGQVPGAQPMQQNAGNLFAHAAQQHQQQQQMQQHQMQQQQQMQQQAQQSVPPPAGFFGQAANMMAQGQPQQQFQGQAQPTPAAATGTTYSLIENLTPEEIEAFKADQFTPGNLPFSPPPREFIN